MRREPGSNVLRGACENATLLSPSTPQGDFLVSHTLRYPHTRQFSLKTTLSRIQARMSDNKSIPMLRLISYTCSQTIIMSPNQRCLAARRLGPFLLSRHYRTRADPLFTVNIQTPARPTLDQDLSRDRKWVVEQSLSIPTQNHSFSGPRLLSGLLHLSSNPLLLLPIIPEDHPSVAC